MRTKTALLSVYNKEGIVEFATSLIGLGFDIFASGGTAKALQSVGLPVIDVASIVGEPILGHRVVTLSREIHAALLARDNDEDRAELTRLNVPFIDLVCCDLYPLQDEIENLQATRESVIEKTDIGGPTMLRSAAKGRRIVIADPADRDEVIFHLQEFTLDEEMKSRLIAKAEFILAKYCMYSATYHSGGKYEAAFYDHTTGSVTSEHIRL